MKVTSTAHTAPIGHRYDRACPHCADGGDVVQDGHRGDRCVICAWRSPGYGDHVLSINDSARHHPLIGLIHAHEDQQRRAS